MVSRHEVTLNLSRLLRSDPHAEGELDAEGEFLPDPQTYPAELKIDQPLHYRLSLRNMGGGDLLLTGHVEGQVSMPCRRCLAPVTVESQSDLIYTMEYDPKQEELTLHTDEDDSEVLLFGRPEVDFALLLTEVFTVDLPLTVACPEGVECQDLTRIYGIDHEHAAGERSPFAVLKDFDPESKKE
jgi:uncharacterized metal-binding protein YceD (DUF177 family)